VTSPHDTLAEALAAAREFVADEDWTEAAALWQKDTLAKIDAALALRAGSGDSEPVDVASDVRAFHEALDIPVGSSPALRRGELRAALIEEEASETVTAIRAGDLVQAIDGLCDLLCVVHGAALEFGVDLTPFWREVHRSNMAKAGGPKRSCAPGHARKECADCGSTGPFLGRPAPDFNPRVDYPERYMRDGVWSI
jgi:stage V sporulation protein SpoVS